MTSRYSVLALVLSALTACADAAGDDAARLADPSALWTAETAPPIERRGNVVAWDTVFVIGGPRDTLLGSPSLIRAAGGRVYVFDGDARRLLAFDAAGRPLWTFGRAGGGPGEFSRVLDMQIAPGGGVVLVDPANRRVTEVAPDGAVVREVPVPDAVGQAAGVVPLDGGDYLLWSFGADSPLVRLDRTGAVVARQPFPWAGYARLHAMARQGTIAADPETGRWTFAFVFGNGWFAFRGTEPAGFVGRYVEHTEWPEIAGQSHADGGATVTSAGFATPPVVSAWRTTMSDGVLHVVFLGTGPRSQATVDLYSVANGEYISSYTLPFGPGPIAFDAGVVYALVSDPYPRVLALRGARP